MKIMIVEDDPLIAFALRDLLRQYGSTVIGPFSKQKPAFEAMAIVTPDLALLDMRLANDETSFELARALRDDGVPMLFVSAFASVSPPPDLQHVPFIRKPYHPTDLIKAIDAVMHERNVSASSPSSGS
jgi:two-component SAPR family response regulator